MARKQKINRKKAGNEKKIRYAVIGLGHIAQVAVLPAFRHASKEAELTALISGDPKKLRTLGKKYKIRHLFSYDDFEKSLDSGTYDALYIALPNHLHVDYAEKALQRGIHVLCEKPLGVTEEECWRMIEASRSSGAKLMTAYRLHFEEANLKAIRQAQNKLGNLRFFNSSFSSRLSRSELSIKVERPENTG